MTKTVTFHTLGCRLNFSETSEIAQKFTEFGYKIVEFGETADVSFLNTCTVTDGADTSCRNLIRKAQKNSPEGKIVVAGCYAQMEAEAISKMQGVDLILGTSEKYKVFDYLTSEEEQIIKIDQTNEFWEASTNLSGSHTRAFLKIQDGCNYVCSFCVIPFARGRSKAISVSEAIAKAKEIVGNGFKEIVLTGVNIGEYENSSGEKLSKLAKELLKTDGLERLRMSSVEANTITEELLEVLANSSKACDHFHIPLQSGDDEILKLMRRKYTVADYTKTIEKIKKYFPNAGIGADVIVGFPGETEKQFKNTASLLAELPITHFHIFPFSRRKNTTAAMIPNQIQETVKNLRVKTLRNLGFEKLNSFSQQNVGKFGKVLFENLEENGLCEGYTTNYLRVYIKNDKNLKNELRTVKLTKFEDGKLIASLEDDTKN